MSTQGLAELAEAQATALRAHMSSYDYFVDHVNRIVSRAVNEDRG
jgi:hypothetical protein